MTLLPRCDSRLWTTQYLCIVDP